jgi:hypothetical protein
VTGGARLAEPRDGRRAVPDVALPVVASTADASATDASLVTGDAAHKARP